MQSIFDSIKYLKGVGEKRAILFNKLGIYTIYDLLWHIPRGYTDYSKPIAIKDTALGENAIIKGRITRKLMPSFIRKGMTIYKAIMTDDVNDITIIIYNSEYLFNTLRVGEEYILNGKISGTLTKKEISSPVVIPVYENVKIQPSYALTEGLSQKVLINTVKNALSMFDKVIYEPVSRDLLLSYNLPSFTYAISKIHFPDDEYELAQARKTLVFTELLILQLAMLLLKTKNRNECGYALKNISVQRFYDALPFECTKSQKSSIEDCLKDMSSSKSMNRLIQGDVGSGKTVVAAACCFATAQNGYQSALMAPTEILATQHYNTLSQFLEPLGIRCCLLTGSLTPKNKTILKTKIENGEYDVIIGTHALIVATTKFKNLNLVITDEQHRFGVNQRADLSSKGNNPHKLVMSATPIPRTLALMIYGDLDISIINELPKGRQSIETYAITGKLRQRAFNFVKGRLDEGRQAYIVCPAIDEGETDMKAVTSYAHKIKADTFKDYSIAVLHGKMSAQEKDKIMTSFKNHEVDILVSTTVVEVGVDVPNAAVIVIENADHFGLSQLHQLRGRVGRGQYKSYCIIITDNVNEVSKKRLKILSSTNDGFAIAEEDLKLRGPGDFFGHRQHGLPLLKIANMADDLDTMKQAQACAKNIISKDRSLSFEENKNISQLVKMQIEKCNE